MSDLFSLCLLKLENPSVNFEQKVYVCIVDNIVVGNIVNNRIISDCMEVFIPKWETLEKIFISKNHKFIKNDKCVVIGTIWDGENFIAPYDETANNLINETRHDIINRVSRPEQKYLEIGIDCGLTFNNTHFIYKTGVDPSPSYKDDNIVVTTSDIFFGNLNKDTIFDVIFIDGMYQTEYVLNDINNSIQFLSENGLIILDDILPISFDEQIKVPINHIYEDGIMKSLDMWTGDVWRVLYYILLFYSEKISIKYFSNDDIRGICIIKINEKFQININDIQMINNYDYNIDFNNYKILLDKLNS